MKKTFLLILGIAALTSCSKSDILDINKNAISFGQPFVNNSTKAAIDASYSGTKDLTSFKVYGTVTGNGNTISIYNGNDVVGKIGDDVWGCTGDEQYWVPNCSYKFYAIADATSVSPETGMPTTITYNENTTANGDLLFASVDDTTDELGNPSKGNPVKFTFTHLLSKAKFTFIKNAYNNSRYTYTVKNIKFIAYKQGKYTISSGLWGSQDTKGEITFGNLEGNITTTNATTGLESAAEKQFIPATYSASNPLTISFDIVMMLDGKEISYVNQTKTFPNEGEYTFAKATSYNFEVILGDNNLITFTVKELQGWDSKTDISIP